MVFVVKLYGVRRWKNYFYSASPVLSKPGLISKSPGGSHWLCWHTWLLPASRTAEIPWRRFLGPKLIISTQTSF